MSTERSDTAARILVVDDNLSIHDDFRRILNPPPPPAGLAAIDADLGRTAEPLPTSFRLSEASDGHAAVAAQRGAQLLGDPIGVAFVDLRMPVGPDGLETAEQLLAADRDLQVVLCTAYSDHPWPAITKRIGETDRVLILKKPFDPIEVQQLASALSAKWRLIRDNRRQMEEINARQLQLQAIMDHAPVAVVLADDQGVVRLVNTAFEKAVGVTRHQALGKNLPSLLPPELQDAARERMEGVLKNGELAVNERELADPADPDHPRRYLLSSFPVTDERGQRGVCAIATDITKRRELEDLLRQAQKMEAIGRLAGGIAHDFNNLLTAILGYAELLRMHVPNDERLTGYTAEIARAGQRAAGLTRQLLAFSRRQVLAPQVMDLNHLVKDMERLLARLVGDDIALELRLQQALGSVRVDPSQLEQVVMNLVINARDALLTPNPTGRTGPGARVSIVTADVRLDEAALRPHQLNGLSLTPGLYSCLAVSDNGPGMDSATKAHIFEPFFTTKGDRKGTGLGLSTVYGIVQQSGGFIEVDSVVGKGATFRILLPHAGEPAKPKDPSGVYDRSPGGSETVLLVEDEAEVRSLLEQVLCNAGYTVLAAEDPEVALGLAHQYGGRIDVMVTDMVMPQMGGNELRNAVIAINPAMKVIFMSGYADREQLQRSAAGRHPFLQKPFKTEELLRAVRQVLEGAR